MKMGRVGRDFAGVSAVGRTGLRLRTEGYAVAMRPSSCDPYAPEKAQEAGSTWERYRPGVQLYDELTLLVGHHQGTQGFAELGIGRIMYAVGHIPAGVGYYLESEVRVHRPELFGVKVGACESGGFAVDAQLN